MNKHDVDVVGLGYNSVDLLCSVPDFPKKNTKMSACEFSRQGGGQVATAMTALSIWKIKTAYIGKVGDDENGAFTINELKKKGVDTSAVIIKKGAATQFAIIISPARDGERTILWKREPGVNLKPDDIKKKDVLRGKILHVDGHEIDAAILAARWAKEGRMKVVFDAEKVLSGTDTLISLTDYLITSEEFPKKFTGIRDNKQALKKLKEIGPEMVIMTLGKKGALAFNGKRFIRSPGVKVNAVDTTGAGDIFHAAYIYGLLQEWETHVILQFANTAAALKCRSLGGRAGIPALKEILHYHA